MRLEQKGHCHTEPWHAGTWDTRTWGTHRHGGHTGHTDTYGIHRHTGHMDTWTHGTHGHTGHMDTGDTQTHGCWATFQLTKGCALTELLPLLCSGSVPAQWKWCCVPHGLAGISALLPAEEGGAETLHSTAQHSTAASPLHHILCSKEVAFSSFSPSSSLEDMVPLDDKRCSLCPNSPAKAKPAVRAGGGPGGTPVHGAVPAARSAAGGGVAKGTKGCGDCTFHGYRAGWVAPTPSQ